MKVRELIAAATAADQDAEVTISWMDGEDECHLAATEAAPFGELFIVGAGPEDEEE